MRENILFVVNSVLLGLGMAADAFSVAVANGVARPGARARELLRPAAVFGAFQTAAPLLGFFVVRAAAPYAPLLRGALGFAAPLAVAALGLGMLLRGLGGAAPGASPTVGLRALLLQGAATSADAFCAGIAESSVPAGKALLRAGVIGAVTFLVCLTGGAIGRRAGGVFGGKSEAIGGGVLLAVGGELLLRAFRG